MDALSLIFGKIPQRVSVYADDVIIFLKAKTEDCIAKISVGGLQICYWSSMQHGKKLIIDLQWTANFRGN
jgi:hypothetical protein